MRFSRFVAGEAAPQERVRVKRRERVRVRDVCAVRLSGAPRIPVSAGIYLYLSEGTSQESRKLQVTLDEYSQSRGASVRSIISV